MPACQATGPIFTAEVIAGGESDWLGTMLFETSPGLFRYGSSLIRATIAVRGDAGVAHVTADGLEDSLSIDPIEVQGAPPCLEYVYTAWIPNVPFRTHGFTLNVNVREDIQTENGWRQGPLQTLVRYFPGQTITHLDALDLATGAGGMLWAATPQDGLLGLDIGAVDGEPVAWVHYPGGSLTDDRTPTFEGPQGDIATRLTRQGERGLWIGSWARGLTWFDPGEQPLAREDDRWVHALPPMESACTNDYLCMKDELRETVMALLPEGGQSLWVGTLNGLYRLVWDGETPDASHLVWTRMTDGQALALARGGSGALWAGFTTALESDVPGGCQNFCVDKVLDAASSGL